MLAFRERALSRQRTGGRLPNIMAESGSSSTSAGSWRHPLRLNILNRVLCLVLNNRGVCAHAWVGGSVLSFLIFRMRAFRV